MDRRRSSGWCPTAFQLRKALQDAGRLDEAAEEFSTALRFNPNSAKAHANLATVLIGKGNLEEAQTHFEAALRIDPNNVQSGLTRHKLSHRWWERAW